MKRIEHSPGPWITEGRADHWEIMSAGGKTTVATVPFKEGDEQDALRTLADASLMEAAPTLLLVCKAVLARLDLEGERGRVIFPCAALRDDLRAAIALAYRADDVARGAEEDAAAEAEEVTS